MGIKYIESEQLFLLNTPNTTYAIGIADEKYLGHIYYGSKIDDTNLRYLLRENMEYKIPSKNKREKNNFLDCFPMEYPQSGIGDYRESCLTIRDNNGYRGSELFYKSHNIVNGKPKLEGLPATFADNHCSTLYIECEDPILKMNVILYYSVYESLDVITRNVEIINNGDKEFYIEKVLSACIDMDDMNFEMISLCGSWARERHIERNKIGYGRQNISSFRAVSSHQEHPFLALVTPGTNNDFGEVYAMNFVYSGNFIAQVEKNQFDSIRMSMGIHPDGFEWKLLPKHKFVSPEVVIVYSDQGINKMTHTFHDLYRNHLIRSKYKNTKRPILINNWEATYFEFDEKKLLDIAKQASELGIEMLVMDDGWFGERNNDDSSLGDWIVNEEKIKGGLGALVENVKKQGLKFGIWFEPEMISPNSNLYRKHHDWAIQIPNREITESRAQYVLDLSRKEVVDYVYESVAIILRNFDISYVKWDMNRQLCTLGSIALDSSNQGELYHRYMLAVYELQERLINEFPDLLLENCSGGGARFDPGMIYYSPQIWCSDDTDAIERLLIQEGTSMIYPLSCIGSHISTCPNHIVGRCTPFETRGHVALFGTFGYELDLTKLSNDEKQEVKKQIAIYHKYNDLIREGDYYRLLSFRENRYYDSWMVVSKDKRCAIIAFVQVLSRPNIHSLKLKLKGLNENILYDINGEFYKGGTLMKAGILMTREPKDFASKLIYIKSNNI